MGCSWGDLSCVLPHIGYGCLVFPPGLTTNLCCGLFLPCIEKPCCIRGYYAPLLRSPHFTTLKLFPTADPHGCLSVPAVVLRCRGAAPRFTLLVSHGNAQDIQFMLEVRQGADDTAPPPDERLSL